MPDFTIQRNVAMRFINTFPSSVRGMRVVDVGGGDGFMALHFARNGAESVILVEPMEGVVLPEALDHPRIVRTTSVDSVVSQHDMVWCHHVLEHIPAPIGFLRTIRDMLHPGGWLWLAVPNMAQHSVFSPGHIHNYMAPQLIEQLRMAGFIVKDASVWAENGQLRVRVRTPWVGEELTNEYPEPMAKSLKETGRCPSAALEKWNW